MSTPRNFSRGRRRLSSKRLSGAVPVVAVHDKAKIAQMYSKVLKMSTENKINTKNTWSLHLIDYMNQLLMENVNFQKASCTLDASVKIYASRVDDVWTTSYRVLENLTRSDAVGRGAGGAGGGDGGGNGQGQTARSRAPRSATSTLESNPANITLKNFDAEFDVDPLFHKMSKAFDEGGARGLLLNNLHVQRGCRLAFDSVDVADVNLVRGVDGSFPGDVDSYDPDMAEGTGCAAAGEGGAGATLGDVSIASGVSAIPAGDESAVLPAVDTTAHSDVDASVEYSAAEVAAVVSSMITGPAPAGTIDPEFRQNRRRESGESASVAGSLAGSDGFAALAGGSEYDAPEYDVQEGGSDGGYSDADVDADPDADDGEGDNDANKRGANSKGRKAQFLVDFSKDPPSDDAFAPPPRSATATMQTGAALKKAAERGPHAYLLPESHPGHDIPGFGGVSPVGGEDSGNGDDGDQYDGGDYDDGDHADDGAFDGPSYEPDFSVSDASYGGASDASGLGVGCIEVEMGIDTVGEQLPIRFCQRASTVDVRRLKERMWKDLTTPSDAEQHPPEEGQGAVQPRPASGDEDIDGGADGDVAQDNNRGRGDDESNKPRVVSFKDTVSRVSVGSSPDTTVPFYFICLLHLANEHGLEIHPESDRLDDFNIAVPAGASL